MNHTRVTDEQVIHMLSWARNYGDVTSWERVASRGAKWLISLAQKGITIESPGRALLDPRPLDVVPQELVLSNREVLLLCYGLAIGGERIFSRSAYRDRWNRGEKFEPEALVLQ
jgi:hypothetical protein